jgi:HK97 family phage portal protein
MASDTSEGKQEEKVSLRDFFGKHKKKRNADRSGWDEMLGLGWSLGTSQPADSVAVPCIDRIACEVATLSGHVYGHDGRPRRDHWMESLFRSPSGREGHFMFFYGTVVDYFHGGAVWYKGRSEGAVRSLTRIPASDVVVTGDGSGHFTFSFYGNTYPQKDVVYIPARIGYSPASGGKSIFRVMSGLFDMAGSVENFTRNSFRNGAGGKRLVMDISGAYPECTPEQARKLKETFKNENCGVENAGSLLLKKKGIEYSTVDIGPASDNQAAELSKVRDFQRKEISSLFAVPPEILNASGGDIENLFVLLAEFGVRPVATQIQEALNTLIQESGSTAYFEFDYNGILKVSLQSRVQAYREQIASGLLSPNEARRKENLGPTEAGDTYFVPVNYMPLTKETVEAYMAKQKKEIAESGKHFKGGDDKQ